MTGVREAQPAALQGHRQTLALPETPLSQAGSVPQGLLGGLGCHFKVVVHACFCR